MNYLTEFALSSCAIVLLLAAAHSVGRLFENMRLPRVIGEITGGLLLGPTLLSHFFAAPLHAVFAGSSWNATLLPILSQVGLVLLMFFSGTHLRSFVQRDERKLVSLLAVGGIVIPFVVGLIAVQFIDTAQLQGSANNRLAFLLVFATAIAIASIPVISRIMLDLGIMSSRFARIVISTAVIDDLVLYVVLAVALGLVRSPISAEHGLPRLLGLESAGAWATSYHVLATVLFSATVLLVGPFVLRRAASVFAQLPRARTDLIVQIVFLGTVTALSLFLNVNPMFGALAAGIVVGRLATASEHVPARTLQLVGQKLFVPLYFALVGFKLDLIHHFDATFFLGFLAFACLVKALSIYLSARIAGQTNRMALSLADALNARGGPGIVLASVAYETRIINESFFAVLVLTAVVTSLMAGAWLGAAVRNSSEFAPTRRQPIGLQARKYS